MSARGMESWPGARDEEDELSAYRTTGLQLVKPHLQAPGNRILAEDLREPEIFAGRAPSPVPPPAGEDDPADLWLLLLAGAGVMGALLLVVGLVAGAFRFIAWWLR